MFYNIIIINLLFYPFSKQKNTPKKKIAKQNKRCMMPMRYESKLFCDYMELNLY